jgi:subtilisin family serine protease
MANFLDASRVSCTLTPGSSGHPLNPNLDSSCSLLNVFSDAIASVSLGDRSWLRNLFRSSDEGCDPGSTVTRMPTYTVCPVADPTISLAPGTYDIQVQPSQDAIALPVSPDPLLVPAAVPFNRTFGYGLVDAATAVSRAINPQSIPFPNVPNLGGNSWDLDLVKAPEVWSQGFTGQGIVVAVVDTGVDYTHPDLDANIWTNLGEVAGDGIDNDRNGFIDDIRGWDFVSNDNNPMDDDSHGTHVAGTIAAENNGIGNTGVAYNAQIMPIKVLGPNGGSSTAVAAGIRYAANNGARVINLSLGGGSASTAITEAIRYAVETKGATVVIASGNEGRTRPSFPANLSNTWGISVGAVDRTSRLANFSNRAGQQTVDYVTAPGVSILSTTPNNTYSSYSGTSMATPHVAGVVALMLSANPTLTPAQIEQLVTQTANPAGVRV